MVGLKFTLCGCGVLHLESHRGQAEVKKIKARLGWLLYVLDGFS